jgi:hypothetical protein
VRRQQIFRSVIVAAAVATSAGLAACSQAPAQQAPGSQGSAGIAPGEPSPQGPGQGTGQSAEHPGEGTGFGKCAAETLSMRVEYHGDEDVARSADLFIANVGSKSCNLSGFPELKFYDANNQPISIPSASTGESQELLEIKPGERFTASLGWSSSPEASPCTEPKTVRVTPPNTSDAKQIPWTGGKVCSRGVSVSPYQRA